MRSRFILRYLFVLAALGFTFVPSAFAQANGGVIHGTVADPTGAVIPSATVKITTPNGHPSPTQRRMLPDSFKRAISRLEATS